MGGARKGDEPAEWSIERADKLWSKADVLELRKRVANMSTGDREKFLDEWSRDNFGQELINCLRPIRRT